jgi:hypothetical protein
LQRITWLTLFFVVNAWNLQLTVLVGFSAMSIHLLQSDSRAVNGEWAEEDDLKLDDIVEVCREKVSFLKALHAAWEEFWSELGVSASDIDNMIGMPFMGGMGPMDFVQEIVGEVPLDEEYQRECLAHMQTFWKTKLEDRYAVGLARAGLSGADDCFRPFGDMLSRLAPASALSSDRGPGGPA